jgi:type I restriction enzyme M protein
MSENFSGTAAFIWSVADLLRGDFKQSQYGRIILPFTLLRRLECVLESSKDTVLAEVARLPDSLPDQARERFLLKAAGLSFYNSSPMNLSKLGAAGIKDNLNNYISSFSKDAREIFEYFNFEEFVSQLDSAGLLYTVVAKFASTDLSPGAITNHQMGQVFEELIRRFAEGSNETAGEHFTPRDIVRLTTSLVFMEDDEALTTSGVIRTIYDPTAGTGGFLSSGMEYVHGLNPQAVMRAFGQELNPESYAICKADMLIKGQDVSRIKLGNTLSDDQLPADKFDYMLSNPPFGVDWKKVEGVIKTESQVEGFDGRFGPGLPRVSDGSLLFLMHLVSKFREPQRDLSKSGLHDTAQTGSRIGIILNGSPLFTGGAGSGESEIRRYMLETDLVEAIIALPNDMFYNTGIATYVWILSNKKSDERKGKVQLIDAGELHVSMRKSLGSKRKMISDEQIDRITRCFGDFKEIEELLDAPEKAQGSSRGRKKANPTKEKPKKFSCKIFDTTDFGYRRITVERPLRITAQFTDEAVASLQYAPKPFNAPMKFLLEKYAPTDGIFTAEQITEIRGIFKQDFKELKEKQLKEILAPGIWIAQQQLHKKAQQLQSALGKAEYNNYPAFETSLKAALKSCGIKLDNKESKQLTAAITRENPDAEPVIKKVHKNKAPNPVYGLFAVNGQTVEYKPSGNLRDNENIPLNPSVTTTELIESYFKREVAPHVPDAWIDAAKRDHADEETGIVGYEIPFNRHFYQYIPPRSLEEIDAELDEVTKDIMKLLQEVHS